MIGRTAASAWKRRAGSRLALLAVVLLSGSLHAAKKTELVSRGIFGVSGNAPSLKPSLAKNGRFVAFESTASDLVPGDTNGVQDIFVRDRKKGTVERVSISSDSDEANAGSGSASISGSGRFVVFESAASNLVLGDGNGVTDVFVHDRKFGLTSRVSVDSFGAEANAFSSAASISGDGKLVVFQSNATNLASGDTNGVKDVFIRHLIAGTTRRVSVSSRGDQGNGESSAASVSWDGRHVVFVSASTNLIQLDTNGFNDVFVRDLHLGTTRRVSHAIGGFIEGDGDSFAGHISANGRFVYFGSSATNLIVGDVNGVNDVFLYDRNSFGVTRISVSSQGQPADENCTLGGISRDGRYAVFRSLTDQLVPGDSNGFADAFLFDRKKGRVQRVSLASNGSQANAAVFAPTISANGKLIAFDSAASNLTGGDVNGMFDVFTRRRKR